MTLSSWPEISVFMGLVLAISVFIVIAAGHFPARYRMEALRTATGLVILWGSIGILSLSSLVATHFAYALIPWYAAILAAGFMILIAPLLVQPLADRFVNGRSALLVLAFIALALDATALKLLG